MNNLRSKYKCNALRKERTTVKEECKCNISLSKYSNKEEYDSTIEILYEHRLKSEFTLCNKWNEYSEGDRDYSILIIPQMSTYTIR